MTDVAAAVPVRSDDRDVLSLSETSGSAYRAITLDEHQNVVVEVSQRGGLSPDASFQLVNPSGNNVAFAPSTKSPGRSRWTRRVVTSS